MKEKKRVLVLAPHTDDGEFGCGGTIANRITSYNVCYTKLLRSAEREVGGHYGGLLQIVEHVLALLENA